MERMAGGARMTRAKTLLVALDDSAEPPAILPLARGPADLVGATLRVLQSQDGAPSSAAIVKRAVDESACFIAMGSRIAAIDADPVGSAVQDVLRSSPCPVVLVSSRRQGEPWALHRLLL